MTNLIIWDQVKETDPNQTKQYKGVGGFVGTSINPTYLIQKATKIWGPIGTNWGYEILEDRFDHGAPVIDEETKVPTGAFFQTHTIKLQLWYMAEKEKRTVIHYGHTPFVYRNKYGIQMDYEAPKKSLTDALKKCLTMLGFSADIMMGDFEDPDYRQEVEEKVRVEKSEDKIRELETIKLEQKEWLEKHCDLLSTAVNLHELETVFKIVVKTLKRRKDEESIKRVTKIKDAKKEELSQKESAA
jgi:hypothetical protein